MNQPETLRLNKMLALTGVGSRRAADALIAAGHVRVNGKVATIGQQVTFDDTIEVDGHTVKTEAPTKIVVALHKPKGVTTTKKDRFAKVTVMDFLPPKYRSLFPVGRLDKDSRGLLLLTNDGDLALKLTHPRYEHEKEYSVTAVPFRHTTKATFSRDMKRLATTIIDPEQQQRRVGVTEVTFDNAKQSGTATVVLKEGKNRQIRRLFQTLGYFVTDLVRTRIADVTLDGLKEGDYRLLEPETLR